MKIFSCSSLYRSGCALVVMAVCATLTILAGAGTASAAFTNMGSVANTRHNMTQSTMIGGLYIATMDNARNDYGEVCVYCHTPHGSTTAIAAPLWNRTTRATTYQTYNQLGTSSLTQAVSQPGDSSLTCLSCHDGQTAIDSIINMPGSGRYSASQATTQNLVFLNVWNNTDVRAGAADTMNHMGMNSRDRTFPGTPGYFQGDGTGGDGIGCLVCHSDTGVIGGATDFTVFLIGTDLRNDHPVGVTFPAVNGPGTDWNTPVGVKGSSLYFDMNGDGKMDKAEVRTYDGRVECASCHDPHGVPSAGPGSMFKPTFLRVDNAGSTLCITCHAK